VFGFIIPVFKTTRKIKRSFRQMQEQMQQPGATDKHHTATQETEIDKKNKAGDYIEFEEVK
jgi:ribosomal protein S1